MNEIIMKIGSAVYGFFAGIDGAALLQVLGIVGVGMLGIFVVIGTIVLVVLILRWMSGRLDRKED